MYGSRVIAAMAALTKSNGHDVQTMPICEIGWPAASQDEYGIVCTS